MNLSPILSPDGRPMFSAGGQQSFRTIEYRGWIVSLEWVGRGKHSYAAMVIWPASNILVAGEGHGMWCISRRCISEFVEFNADDKCTGGPSAHCFREAREALPILGKDINDKEALTSLVDAVVRFAPELVLMPATPKAIKSQLDQSGIWEVKTTIKDTGKVMHEGLV